MYGFNVLWSIKLSFSFTSRYHMSTRPIHWVPLPHSWGAKRSEYEAKVKNVWRFTSTPPIRFHFLVRLHRDDFNLKINYQNSVSYALPSTAPWRREGEWKYESVSKSFPTGPLERELQMVHLSATRCSYIDILWVSVASFAAITLCVASQRVFIVVSVYFVIDSVRKLLDKSSYMRCCWTWWVSLYIRVSGVSLRWQIIICCEWNEIGCGSAFSWLTEVYGAKSRY
jgi:hypothetical protein